MDKSLTGLPVIATSNGWTPIAFLNFRSDYARQKPFLIWMADDFGREWFEVVRMEQGRIIREIGNVCARDGAPHACGMQTQLAFKFVDGPDLDALHRIDQRCADHFPRLK